MSYTTTIMTASGGSYKVTNPGSAPSSSISSSSENSSSSSGSSSHSNTSTPIPTMIPTSQKNVYTNVSTPESFAAAKSLADSIKAARASELSARGGVPVSAKERVDFAQQQSSKYGVGVVPQLRDTSPLIIVDAGGRRTEVNQLQSYQIQSDYFSGKTGVTNPRDYGTVISPGNTPSAPVIVETTPKTSSSAAGVPNQFGNIPSELAMTGYTLNEIFNANKQPQSIATPSGELVKGWSFRDLTGQGTQYEILKPTEAPATLWDTHGEIHAGTKRATPQLSILGTIEHPLKTTESVIDYDIGSAKDFMSRQSFNVNYKPTGGAGTIVAGTALAIGAGAVGVGEGFYNVVFHPIKTVKETYQFGKSLVGATVLQNPEDQAQFYALGEKFRTQPESLIEMGGQMYGGGKGMEVWGAVLPTFSVAETPLKVEPGFQKLSVESVKAIETKTPGVFTAQIPFTKTAELPLGKSVTLDLFGNAVGTYAYTKALMKGTFGENVKNFGAGDTLRSPEVIAGEKAGSKAKYGTMEDTGLNIKSVQDLISKTKVPNNQFLQEVLQPAIRNAKTGQFRANDVIAPSKVYQKGGDMISAFFHNAEKPLSGNVVKGSTSEQAGEFVSVEDLSTYNKVAGENQMPSFSLFPKTQKPMSYVQFGKTADIPGEGIMLEPGTAYPSFRAKTYLEPKAKLLDVIIGKGAKNEPELLLTPASKLRDIAVLGTKTVEGVKVPIVAQKVMAPETTIFGKFKELIDTTSMRASSSSSAASSHPLDLSISSIASSTPRGFGLAASVPLISSSRPSTSLTNSRLIPSFISSGSSSSASRSSAASSMSRMVSPSRPSSSASSSGSSASRASTSSSTSSIARALSSSSGRVVTSFVNVPPSKFLIPRRPQEGRSRKKSKWKAIVPFKTKYASSITSEFYGIKTRKMPGQRFVAPGISTRPMVVM